jgi:hypothetical protein
MTPLKKILTMAGLTGVLFALWACSPGGPPPDYYRVTEADVKILEEARALIPDDSKWAHNDDQQCDLEATSWTLFCALQKASFDVLGEFQLRRPALEETRYVIDEMTKQGLEKRLIDYNNLPSTKLDDIHKVLDIALEKIKARLAAAS